MGEKFPSLNENIEGKNSKLLISMLESYLPIADGNSASIHFTKMVTIYVYVTKAGNDFQQMAEFSDHFLPNSNTSQWVIQKLKKKRLQFKSFKIGPMYLCTIGWLFIF